MKYYRINRTFDTKSCKFEFCQQYPEYIYTGSVDIFFFKNQKLHREIDKPAKYVYYQNYNKPEKYYLKNDLLHRENGPASYEFFGLTNCYTESFYYNGIFIGESLSIDHFKKMIKLLVFL